jgi:hypothetical protein
MCFEFFEEVVLDKLREAGEVKGFKGVVNVSGLQTLGVSSENLIIDLFDSALESAKRPSDGSPLFHTFKKIVIFVHRLLSNSLRQSRLMDTSQSTLFFM